METYPLGFKLPPWAHQKELLDHIHSNNVTFYALLHDMGSGKTKSVIEIMRLIFSKKDRVVKTLIICPLVVMQNWSREIEMHSYIAPNTVAVIDGKTKLDGKKVKTAQLKLKIEQLKSNAEIFVINTDSVGNANLWPIILSLGIELIIVDESHRFKGFNTTRTKALHKLTLQNQLEYRYILTGSPVLQDACDLWAQFFILNPDILGRNFYNFRNKYFYDANASMPSHVHFPNYVPKDEKYYKRMGLPYQDDTAELNKIIYQHASRVMKDDVLDLPPYTSEVIEVELGKDQARIYKEMKDDLVATLNETTLVSTEDLGAYLDLDNNEVMSADLAIVKTLRLMQLTAGVFVNEDGVTTLLKTNLEAQLKDMLEEICANKENKVIVWTIFKPTYALVSKICEGLGIKYTLLTGLQDKDQKQANVDAFNTDKEIQVIIANQGAGGTGVNLTAANYDIYYSYDFSLEKHLQSGARGYRGGQTRKYTSYKLVTLDTISERTIARLNEKAANAEDILATNKEMNRGEILGLI